MASRDLNDLKEPVRRLAERFLSLCAGANLDVLIYCTYRAPAEQAILFRQGRTLAEIEQRAQQLSNEFRRPDLAEILLGVGPQQGKRKKTWAAPGQSFHNYGLAFDGVPLIGGKPIWLDGTTPEERELWNQYGDLGETAGLKWSGRWLGGKAEFPHLQARNVSWRELIREPLG